MEHLAAAEHVSPGSRSLLHTRSSSTRGGKIINNSSALPLSHCVVYESFITPPPSCISSIYIYIYILPSCERKATLGFGFLNKPSSIFIALIRRLRRRCCRSVCWLLLQLHSLRHADHHRVKYFIVLTRPLLWKVIVSFFSPSLPPDAAAQSFGCRCCITPFSCNSV